MPKLTGGGNQKRRKKTRGHEQVGRELQLKDDGQEYAQVSRILGGTHVEGACFDGQTRLCVIRGAMRRGGAQNRVLQGDIILVSLRDFQDGKADVILRYTAEDARKLKSMGELPDNANLNSIESGDALLTSSEDSTVSFDIDFSTI